MLGYGILDKQLLRESASELEHLQQPFYAKFLTVTNHTPYYTDDQNFPFPKLNTGNSIVDDYVRTAHYLDQSLEQFFHYLQTTSLYNHSILLFMVTTSVFQMRTTRTYVKLSTAIQKRGQTMTMRNCKEYL